MKKIEWESGEYYTLKCKDTADLKHRTWTNNIRRLAAVDQTVIDYVTTAGEQAETIFVKCGGSEFEPDIFKGQTTWCHVGCAPIPDDYTNFWSPKYNEKSMGLHTDGVPVIADADLEVNVQCKAGYAQGNGDVGVSQVACTEFGWDPDLNQLIKCTAGCVDVRKDIEHGSSIAQPSTEYGVAPFNSGDRIYFSCDSNYKLIGKQVLTCTSGQQWANSVPLCKGGSGDTSSAQPLTMMFSASCIMLWCMFMCVMMVL